MIFRWFRQRRRAQLLARPFPQNWDRVIRDNVLHEKYLTPPQQIRLRHFVQLFVAEKNWEGCGGLELNDEMKVTIAALACLLVVGVKDDWYFDHVLSILVYPTAYVAPGTQVSRAGLVMDGGQPRLGEAWWLGPVILSWSDALTGGRMENRGHNLVLHEFAHQLDMMNGRICDGMPPLETRQEVDRWISVLGPEYERLVHACKNVHHHFFDCYGATNSAEFFAVMTESFFDRPVAFNSHHPDAYQVLRDFYRLDPASWPHMK